MNKSKNKPAKKRTYKKSASPIQLLPPEPKPEKRDMEVAELTQIISIFSNWNDDQKTRNIRFLASKYWEYLKDSTII